MTQAGSGGAPAAVGDTLGDTGGADTSQSGPAATYAASSQPDTNPIPLSRTAIDTQLRSILRDVLGLSPEQVQSFDADTGLFGHLPELDSMAVAGLLTEMEDRLDIVIEDEDVDGEMLETYGGLLAFAEAKAVER